MSDTGRNPESSGDGRQYRDGDVEDFFPDFLLVHDLKSFSWCYFVHHRVTRSLTENIFTIRMENL